ncbi:MAG: hypothetical protein KDC85_14480 [Saprospiraceae bacterium]|nr:hypothetical protein [Saprospiraceae bacterium]MCB9323131.1 hypothetical protein [Lewinellaceae bacterium]
MSHNPILFLDFDGVLQIDKFDNAWRKGLEPLLHGYRDRDRFGFLFDAGCVKNLEQIIDTTGADVVISSSWRYLGVEVMQEMWEARALPGKVVGITHFDEELLYMISRGKEIQDWLDIHKVTNYVIFDDVDDLLPHQKKRFIQTHYETGLTREQAAMAIQMLG